MIKADLRYASFSYISESFWLQKHFKFLKYNEIWHFFSDYIISLSFVKVNGSGRL